jgi:predicted RNA-binding protein with PUA-like domain
MWLVKTEPSVFSFDDLVKEGRTAWDGVTNPAALKNLRAMKSGDKVLVYHTGDERSAVGIAEVVKEAYPDPRKNDPRLVVVDLRAGTPLKTPVPLADLKAARVFAGSPLVRQGRLSVVPLTREQWDFVVKAGGR